VLEQEPLRREIGAGTASLDQITRQRERRSREADDRHTGRKLAPDDANRFAGRLEGSFVRLSRQAIDLAWRPQRLGDDRPFARGERDVDAERPERPENIGKDDRGIQRKTTQRLQGHFCSEFRLPTEVEQAVAFPQALVLR